MNRSLPLIALLLALATTVALAAELAPNFKKTYPASAGSVRFNHQDHAERLKDCAFCHNGLTSFGGKVNEDFAHKFCLTCHQTHDSAPVDCQDCHMST